MYLAASPALFSGNEYGEGEVLMSKATDGVQARDEELRRPADLAYRTVGAVPLRGSLPLNLRTDTDDAEDAATLRPAVLFAPVHLGRHQPLPTIQSAGQAADGLEPAPAPRWTGVSVDGHGGAAEARARMDFPDLAARLLADPSAGTAATALARAADATYDFTEYVLLRDRDDPISPGSYPPEPIPGDPRFQRYLGKARVGVQAAVDYALVPFGNPTPEMGTEAANLRELLYGWWRDVCSVRAFNRLSRYSPEDIEDQAGEFLVDKTPDGYYGSCLGSWLMSVAVEQMRSYLTGDHDAADPLFTVAFWEDVRDAVFANYFNGLDYVDPAMKAGAYPFEPLPVDEVIFGLRVVHRQSWHQLAYGRGDLVGTVPLGPRESRKVSIKATRRSKSGRTSEVASSFETSGESSTTAKDTSEVVDEATAKADRKADGEISGGYPPFVNAKISGSTSEDVGSSSKQTKTSLNERMQKTATRMKRDTKVTVSLEEESTFEQSASTELINPNDEVAVTYLYRRLQQRYWVSAQIDEVNSVVLVPEPVPDFDEVNEDWVRAHGEVLAGALLDASFASVLAAIRTEPGNLQYANGSVFRNAADSAIQATGAYGGYTGGGDLPDVLASGQQFYERDFERREALAMDQARRQHQIEGLLAHLRRNILHYLRAIWDSEEPDQRMQRYSKLRVPVMWTFVPRTPVSGQNVGVGVGLDVDGVFMPALGAPATLDDIIDPVGPVGYLFNCSIWRLRDDPKLINLHQALAHLRAAYTRFAVHVTLPQGSALSVRQAVAVAPRRFSAEYTITYRTARQRWLVPVPNRTEADWIQLNPLPDGSLDVLGIRVWLDGTPADQETAVVSAQVTGELQDPHLLLVQAQSPLPPAGQEAATFSDALLADMAAMYDWPPPGPGRQRTWDDLTVSEKAEVRARYHEFLMLRDSGRLVTLDSANLVLDLELGRSAVLEPFKRLHRYLDVMKEYEELRRRQADNRRRVALLDDNRLGDPDIERVTVVGNLAELNGAVVLDVEEEETVP